MIGPRYDAFICAYLIAQTYAEDREPPVEYLGRTRLTQADVDWAWRYYSDPAQRTSLRVLSEALDARTSTLMRLMRELYGWRYEKIARRRSTGGDLWERHKS